MQLEKQECKKHIEPWARGYGANQQKLLIKRTKAQKKDSGMFIQADVLFFLKKKSTLKVYYGVTTTFQIEWQKNKINYVFDR